MDTSGLSRHISELLPSFASPLLALLSQLSVVPLAVLHLFLPFLSIVSIPLGQCDCVHSLGGV